MDHMLNYTMEMGEIPSSLSKILKPLLFDEQPLPERLEGDCWLLSIFDNFSRKNQTIKGLCRSRCCTTPFFVSSFQVANCISTRK